MDAKFSKRFRAYLIDVVLLFLVLSFISPIIPKSNEETKLADEVAEVLKEYMEGTSKTEEKQDEVADKLVDLSYKIAKVSYLNQIISIAVYLGYFVVMPIFTKGQTLGKKIMKIKIVDMNDEAVNGNRLLVRALILYSIAANTLNLILLLVLDKSAYMTTSGLIGNLFNIILIVSFVMILVRKDKRGLHDLASGTKVISTEESGE